MGGRLQSCEGQICALAKTAQRDQSRRAELLHGRYVFIINKHFITIIQRDRTSGSPSWCILCHGSTKSIARWTRTNERCTCCRPNMGSTFEWPCSRWSSARIVEWMCLLMKILGPQPYTSRFEISPINCWSIYSSISLIHPITSLLLLFLSFYIFICPSILGIPLLTIHINFQFFPLLIQFHKSLIVVVYSNQLLAFRHS